MPAIRSPVPARYSITLPDSTRPTTGTSTSRFSLTIHGTAEEAPTRESIREPLRQGIRWQASSHSATSWTGGRSRSRRRNTGTRCPLHGQGGSYAVQHSRPFLLVVGLFHPHLPWYAPVRYFERFPARKAVLPEVLADDLDDVPDEGRRLAEEGSEVFRQLRETAKWAEAVAAYAANIAFADSLVGRLVDSLDASAYADNTVVLFASDHGFHLGEKSHWYKSTLWERATHVPLIVPPLIRN